MLYALKPFIPARVRRWLRPLTLAYQRKTQGRNEINLFANFIAPGDLVFDVGANVGRMTSLFLGLGAEVVAIEPQPRCAASLRAEFAHNKRFRSHECGVGAVVGELPINICGDIDEVSSFRSDWDRHHHAARWTECLTVPLTTLDWLIERYGLPDFCKIDVEGFELEVFRGLSRAIPALCFEYHPHQQDGLRHCIDRLNALGVYRYNFAPHERRKLELRDWAEPSRAAAWIGGYRSSGDVFARLRA